MEQAMTITSFILSAISVLLIITLNWSALKKIKKAERREEESKRQAKLSKQLEETEYGRKVLEKLEEISTKQELYNQIVMHMLRTDLLSVTDEIFYINRKRNTVSSKWYSLATRLDRYQMLEEIIDAAFASYKLLGGNQLIEERYEECKSIIKETKRQAEE